MYYYTAIIILSCIALSVLCILIHENYRISKKDKRVLYLTCVLIAVSALAEWLGERFSGDTSIPTWSLRVIKCADYILTPIVGGAFIAQFHSNSIRVKLIKWVLILNSVFQVVSCFNNWMIIIDDENDYIHGPLYPFYMTSYLVIIALIAMEFAVYGQHFRRQNRASLYATMILVFFGIFIQEIFCGEIRTAYIALTLGMTAFYIHNAEFSQTVADDTIRTQEFHILVSQIQPHFLFNCLSVIRETYHEDVENGDKAITQFAKYLRHNMDSLIGKQIVSFSEELEHVKGYVDLQKLRFGDELDVRYEFECTDFSLPTLTLQPIVENAITYGVRKQREHTGIVTVQTHDYKDRVEIVVTDNGPGFDIKNIKEDDKTSHIGISNVKERLHKACGGELIIDSVPGEGTAATIIIPKNQRGGVIKYYADIRN
ncbi:MAG: histidine kinase [Lachnospiraceae bacterium]|nr:histidine kinase [Lachnospiraceae bacterium]